MVLNQVLRKLALVTIGVTQFTTLCTDAKTIAILPFSFNNGRPKPEKTVKITTQEVFEKLRFTVHNQEKTMRTWKKDLKLQKPISVPNKDSLIKLGQKLKVDYVCAGTTSWRVTTPWIGTGPKVKAVCTMNCRIVDVHKKKIVLDEKDVQADSHKKENGLEIAADPLLTPLVTLVSSGSRVPHMEYSGKVAILKALTPFVTCMKSTHGSESCCVKKKSSHGKSSCCAEKNQETTENH